MDKQQANLEATRFFEELWQKGDPWSLETSEFERQRFAEMFGLINGKKYARVLEVGCGAGAFTRLLAPIADHVIAMDVSSTAIDRAKTIAGSENVEYRVENAIEFDHHGHEPFDLIVMSETVYYLGWLYSFFDVGWLAHELFEATKAGGYLLLANTLTCPDDALVSPWLIRTYHDLFRNAGYAPHRDHLMRGDKDGATIEVLMSLMTKPPNNPTG